MKVLYHYTAEYHLPSILEEKKLRLSESNLKNYAKQGYDWEAYNRGELKLYKPVVWMTEAEEPDVESIGLYSAVDKTAIKITIKKQAYFKKWKQWSRANGIEKEWARILERGKAANIWWISELEVPFSGIVRIENRYTGEVYYTNPDLIDKLN